MDRLVARHRRWGWASLAAFALVGLMLESLHGFKLALLVDHETRRTMWRLAHAHGALLGLVHLALAGQLAATPGAEFRGRTSPVGMVLYSAGYCSVWCFLPVHPEQRNAEKRQG